MSDPLGYIHKPFSDEQLEAALAMALQQVKIKKSTIPEKSNALYKTFTAGEIQIAELLKQGRATKEICAILDLSPATIIWHRKNIRKKLGIAGTKEGLVGFLLSHP